MDKIAKANQALISLMEVFAEGETLAYVQASKEFAFGWKEDGSMWMLAVHASGGMAREWTIKGGEVDG